MTDKIKNIIGKFEAGYVLTADDFSTTVKEAKYVSKYSIILLQQANYANCQNADFTNRK